VVSDKTDKDNRIKKPAANKRYKTLGFKWLLKHSLPRIKFGVTGQDSSPQSPTFHTADRWRSL